MVIKDGLVLVVKKVKWVSLDLSVCQELEGSKVSTDWKGIRETKETMAN